ncbi:MAG TPA: alpha/beta fold hydrolase [Candidatus Bathyarchaeia archaeon]|nr:alpha/beta fold hydrolase [Candidatus Bathyarchaeia archaeon]
MLCLLLTAIMTASPEQTLAEIRATLPKNESFEAWLEQSGEMPPDFDSIPSRAILPGPLDAGRFGSDTPVADPAQWPARRAQIMESLHQWILGSVPPPPDNLTAEVVDEHEEPGALVRNVLLKFGPSHAASLRVELLIPKGAGPFPVFMTQTNHRAWALVAVRRGYLACVYAGCDVADDTDSFAAAYPNQDWSRLTRRAWAAARCVDYLHMVPQARADQIAITGHSRNGKMSLMAAAIDPRIAVVISSSSGTGGVVSSRYHGEQHFAEGIENITRSFPDWFHPRFRFFAGREDKLPVDLTDLVAMAAPRPCLISTAINDDVESTWAIEQTLLAVRPVYQLFGAPDKIKILWRPGGHETWPTVIEKYVDWCDLQFGRANYDFPDRFIHPCDWAAWAKTDPAPLNPDSLPPRAFGQTPATLEDWLARRTQLPAAVAAVLGTTPGAAHTGKGTYGREVDHIEQLLNRANAPGLEKEDVMFGEYINADVYAKKGTMTVGAKLPVVLWLHPWTCPSGFNPAYHRGAIAHLNFAKTGFAVFCYDQIGFGRRIEEVENFYTRYPGWSLLGKMVRDAQAALDAIGRLDYVDPQRIYVVGYSFGTLVALHLAGLDDRPAGYALACPPVPYRLDTDANLTGGIARWSHLYMVAPRLGYFIGHEDRVPYDLDELMAAVAPKPLLLVTPRLDREAPIPLVEKSIENVRCVYSLNKAPDALTQAVTDTYNHFDPQNQQPIIEWLNKTSH